MDAGTRRALVAVLILIIAVTGGAAVLLGGPGGDAPGPGPSGGATSPLPASAVPASPLTGVIVAVDSRGLTDVRAFTLRTVDGTLYAFDLRELRSTAAFPLGHLAEHQATAEPVVVTFRVEDGILIATAVDDA
ncbi:MAG: hypothetical protein ACLGIJ_10985 [Candidatus Limnocylindria bacterium]